MPLSFTHIVIHNRGSKSSFLRMNVKQGSRVFTILTIVSVNSWLELSCTIQHSHYTVVRHQTTESFILQPLSSGSLKLL